MYATVTKAQAQAVGSTLGAGAYTVYAETAGLVTQFAMFTTFGWTGFAVSGTYSESDFQNDFTNNQQVVAIVLA